MTEALHGTFDVGREAVFKALKRCKMLLRRRTQEPVEVHCADLGLKCNKGRHRSVMFAQKLAEELRQAGCTMEITYTTLDRGIVDVTGRPDWRGPCGCHISPASCQQLACEEGFHFTRRDEVGSEYIEGLDEIALLEKFLSNYGLVTHEVTGMWQHFISTYRRIDRRPLWIQQRRPGKESARRFGVVRNHYPPLAEAPEWPVTNTYDTLADMMVRVERKTWYPDPKKNLRAERIQALNALEEGSRKLIAKMRSNANVEDSRQRMLLYLRERGSRPALLNGITHRGWKSIYCMAADHSKEIRVRYRGAPYCSIPDLYRVHDDLVSFDNTRLIVWLGNCRPRQPPPGSCRSLGLFDAPVAIESLPTIWREAWVRTMQVQRLSADPSVAAISEPTWSLDWTRRAEPEWCFRWTR